MRIATAVLITAVAFAAGATEAPEPAVTYSRTATKAPPPTVNLDRPGVLEAIERDDPDRYRRILTVIEAAKSPTCDHLPQVMKIELNVSAYSCSSAMFLTSHPAKRRLAFAMDDALYVTNVVQDRLAEPKLRKAQDR